MYMMCRYGNSMLIKIVDVIVPILFKMVLMGGMNKIFLIINIKWKRNLCLSHKLHMYRSNKIYWTLV